MATPEETKETMQTETTSDNEVKETVEETTNETAVENDEATFDTIKKELEAQKELLQQSEDHYKRLQADFANFRRRNEKEREELSSVVLQGLIKDLLPIIDNFERALAVEGAAGTPLHDGISMVYNQLMESLKKNGLEVIKAAGEKFLAENKTKEGVKTTESGLQYKVITEGKGEIPADTCKVKVNYKGTLIDGTEFASSYKRNEPATFRANQVIKGWTEALTMMPVGSKWELYIPQELAYGSRESGQIKPFSTLIFEVELVGIEKDKK